MKSEDWVNLLAMMCSPLRRKDYNLMSFSPENQSPDALIAELDSQVQALEPSIVFIDSVTAFEHLYKPEMYMITKRLSYLFRKQSITSIFSILTTQQSGLNLSAWGLSSIFHNIILLRYVEAEAQLKRSMLILKIRASPHDQSILEFSISSKGGIKILGSMTDYVGILSGIAQKRYEQYLKKEHEIENKEKVWRQKRKAKFDESQKGVSIRAKENNKQLRGKQNKRS